MPWLARLCLPLMINPGAGLCNSSLWIGGLFNTTLYHCCLLGACITFCKRLVFNILLALRALEEKLRHMIRHILLTNVVSIWFLIFLSDLDPFILTSYPVVRRELRSYGYSYSLLNGELRSYHEFPNHILASVLASSLQSALRLSQIEMLSVWWKSRLNFLVAWTLSEYGGVMWIFSSCQYMFPLSHGQCKSDSGLVSCGLTLVASWTLCRHGACLSYVWMPRAVWAAMRLLLLAMLTANAKTGMGSSCGNFANVIIYVWSINFSMLVLPIEVNFIHCYTIIIAPFCQVMCCFSWFRATAAKDCYPWLERPSAPTSCFCPQVVLPTVCRARFSRLEFRLAGPWCFGLLWQGNASSQCSDSPPGTVFGIIG